MYIIRRNHQIHHHAGNRHIEPQRESPPRYFFMFGEFPAPRPCDRKKREWHNHRSKHDMRQQYRKIHHPNHPFTAEFRGRCLRMIRHIREEKKARKQKSRQHHRLVRLEIPPADKDIAGRKQHRARTIDKSIERRQH